MSGADCIGYELDVEEYRRHDALAKEWVDVSGVERATPFVLTDDTGTVTVDPDAPDEFRCDISYPESETRKVDEGESPGLEADIDDTGDEEYPRRYRERRLPPDGDLYVLGTATDGGDRITNSDGQSFVLSVHGEGRTMARHTAYALIALVFGLAAAGWGGYVTLVELGLI